MKYNFGAGFDTLAERETETQSEQAQDRVVVICPFEVVLTHRWIDRLHPRRFVWPQIKPMAQTQAQN